MRSRRNTTCLAALVTLALGLTGCSSGSGEITAKGVPTASGSGTDVGSNTDPASGSDGTVNGDSELGSGGDSGTTDTLVPDLGDVSIPDFAGNDKCIGLSVAFGAMAAAAFGTEEDVAKITEQLDGVKTDLPAELQADVDTLAAAFNVVAKDGIIAGGQALDSPEVAAAQKRISDYLETECGGA